MVFLAPEHTCAGSTPAPPIDRTTLTRGVRTALQSPVAGGVRWEIVPLTAGLGAFAVYCLSGTADIGMPSSPGPWC